MADLTPLSQLGEFGLIRRLQRDITLTQVSTVLGIGDDAAILAPPAGQEVVVSTDLLVEGVHFDLSFSPLKHLGYKAVAVNVSDVAAMLATPTQIVVGLSLPPRFTVEAVEELYVGMRLACEAYGVDLVGGDTTSSRGGLVISVTALGQVAAGQAVRRSGGKPTDILCVSGDLGGAYLGLQVLEREKQAFLADRLRELAGEGLGLLVIDHNLDFLLPLADRLACLDRGTLIAEGPPDAVCADPRVREAYLGVPTAPPC